MHSSLIIQLGLNEWFIYDTYVIEEFFQRYNCSFFVVTYADTLDPEYNNKIKMWNDLPYLDIVYTNSLGEIVYKYNIEK